MKYFLSILCFLFWNLSCESKKESSKSASKLTSKSSTNTLTGTKTSVEGEEETETVPAPKADASQVALFMSTQKSILDFRPKLDAEKNRRNKLMMELMANIGAGCMSDADINTIEVIIDGSKLADVNVSTLKQTDQYLPQATEGQINFEFYLGDLQSKKFIKFTNNEATNPIFGNNVHYTYRVPPSDMVKVNFVEMISVKKMAPAYSKVNFCPKPDPSSEAPSNCGVAATLKEIERYEMNAFSVKVNGYLMYTNGSARHGFSLHPGSETDFKSQGLIWQDNNAQLNDSFIALLQRTDCPATPTPPIE